MSYTINTAKEDTLEIRAIIRDSDEWNKFCHALAKYRDKFEPKLTTKERKEND